MVGGFLTQHMTAHIVAMNVVAPFLAVLLPVGIVQSILPRRALAAATALQLALLWGWHAPAVLAAASADAGIMALMHVSLFFSALWFWSAIVNETRRGNWAPLGALLVTGKLFCLLGLLLAFAPRALYVRSAFIESCFGFAGTSFIADQQLAGLLMLTACPLVYVTAAIGIAGRGLRRVGAQDWTPSPRSAD